ncbi:hypothetical protein CIW52_00150 [Mycolicibacterium sp. P9-64]|nr:hypothetical protein CIW52_00150 [Mycolicibacterium sp. P9-64]
MTRFAEGAALPGLAPVIDRLRRRIEVAVVGRAWVGRNTVAAALRHHGVAVTADAAAAEARVLVIAEALKPEERAMAVGLPTLIVLNKADLTGSRSGGALPTAHRMAAEVQRRTGMPTVAMVGLLAATARLEDDLVDALRTLVTTPADLGSVDAFVGAEHPIGRDVRVRLLDRLDRFGIAQAVLALARGDDPAAVPALLQQLSNVEAVLSGLYACTAPVRYRRLRVAFAEMHSLATELDDNGLLRLLNSDTAVLAAMAAAVDVVQADGVPVDPGDHPDAHRRRAVQWRRYGGGPVNALHRTCSADITRGSLRLLDRRW